MSAIPTTVGIECANSDSAPIPLRCFFEWNTATHVQDNEQSPTKRAFTKRELQDFFDHADDQVGLIAASGRKGWLPAYRDATMFKVAYSYGLRFNELRHLQTVDSPAIRMPASSAVTASCRSVMARRRKDLRTSAAAS